MTNKIKGNFPLEKALEALKNNPLISEKQYREVADKASFAIKDGLGDHHVSFCYEENGCIYYREFFGRGWNKRRASKHGWIKYLNSLAYNIYEGRYDSRREVFGV